MRLRPSPRVTAGAVTLAIWALAAGSALFWYLRAGSTSLPVDAAVASGMAAGGVAVDARTVARALGAPDDVPTEAAPAPDIISRVALRGVVTHGGRGAALLAVDGKPAKPVRVGAPLPDVEGGWTVRTVSPRAVVLVAEGREARLEMPPLAQRSSAGDAVAPARPALGAVPFTPAIGTLPPPGAPPAAITPTPRPPQPQAMPAPPGG